MLTAAGDGCMRLWDLRTGALRFTMPCMPPYVERAVFSPDGTRIAVTAGRTVQIWDPATGGRLLTLRSGGQGFLALAFSPDGTRLAAGGERDANGVAIRMWGRTGDRPWPPVLRED
jgi:WD40 repeat protein